MIVVQTNNRQPAALAPISCNPQNPENSREVLIHAKKNGEN
jgi:hypothetical protein